IDDSTRECLRCFLREVMTDAALDWPVLILAGEFSCVRAAFGMWCVVCVAFKGNGWNRDGRTRRELRFKGVVPRFPWRGPDSPSIVVNDDVDVIWIVQRGGGEIERGLVEVPFWRS